MNPVFELRNGVMIPQIGFGTWQIKDEEEMKTALQYALDVGYRHIDTAQIYGNEALIGAVLKSCSIPREELFITSKVWNSSQGYDQTMLAFEESLAKLQTTYLDLYLIHWPAVNLHPNYQEMNQATYKAMEELYRQGKVRAIGVSNFHPHHLRSLFKTATIIPHVNQIEFHPGNPIPDVVDFCRENNIFIEAYSPMMKGKVFQSEVLQSIASKHQRSIPQIVLRWIIEQGICPLSKSITPKRIEQNIQLFDFSLDESDHVAIHSLSFMGRVGTHPDLAQF